MFQFASLHTWNNYIRVLFFYYYISVIVLRAGLLKNTLPNQLALRKQKTKRKIKNVSNFAMAMSCKAPFQELADLFQQRLATPCLSWGGRYVTPLEKKCSKKKKGGNPLIQINASLLCLVYGVNEKSRKQFLLLAREMPRLSRLWYSIVMSD